MVWLAALLPRMSEGWKMTVLLVFFGLESLTGLFFHGPSPGGSLVIVMFVLFATLHFGLRVGILVSVGVAASFAVFGLCWARGLLPPAPIPFNFDPALGKTWVRIGALSTFGALAIAVVVDVMVTRLRGALAETESTSNQWRASEERFREVVENIAEVFWSMEAATGRLLYVSPACAKVWGRSPAELCSLPQSWADCVHPEERERMLVLTRAGENTTATGDSFRLVRPDGTLRWIRHRAFPVRGPAGDIRRVVGVTEDITEHKALEERLLHGQRLESIGTLASGVAHDLNNILTPMLLASSSLKQHRHMDHDARELIEMLDTGTRRGASIAKQLLNFGTGGAANRVLVEPRRLVQEMTQLMKETFPRNISVRVDMADVLWTLEADVTQLQQVLMNLCINARDAMPGGGTITLGACNVAPDDHLSPGGIKGPAVVFWVIDTGHGIPPEIIGRVFDPFFTTKGVGKGSGLGLSSVHGIVKAHGGSVTVESGPGPGTSFRVFLPAKSSGRPQEQSERETNRPARCRGELILVVDDEPSILALTRRVLTRAGYRVVTACNGAVALETFRKSPEAIKLVLTDIMMPELDGAALARQILQLDPGVRIMGVSGLEVHEHVKDKDGHVFAAVLMKPYSPDTLVDAVDRQLA
jgi:hypothetical protein